jgi:hypothetical protein
MGDPQYVVNFMKFVAQDVREHMAKLGFRTIDEMIGRTDKLKQRETDHWKAKDLGSFTASLSTEVATNWTRNLIEQDHGLDNSMIYRLSGYM